jgi:murine toxin
MNEINDVQRQVDAQDYFNHISGQCYIKILDTPHVWGQPFGKQIMPSAKARQAEFERTVEHMVQNARYRCDVSSLNCPNPDWGKVILGAMDTALSTNMNRKKPTQFRFLFGQTPTYLWESIAIAPFTSPF